MQKAVFKQTNKKLFKPPPSRKVSVIELSWLLSLAHIQTERRKILANCDCWW